MNRLILSTVIRSTRVSPNTRSLVPYRWQSSATGGTANQGSTLPAAVAGGLTVLLGGFAWYHFSGTRQVVNTAQEGVKKVQELKDKVKEKASDPSGNATETLQYLRQATATFIPGSAPFLGKVFDQVEEISKEHGDDVKKIFDKTYQDFEKLASQGSLDAKTATKALEILQKRVKEIQDLAGEAGGDAWGKLLKENSQLQEKISGQYNDLKDVIKKAKDKKPEAQKLLKDTGSELVQIFQDNKVSDKSVKKAKELLEKKLEEAKKLGEDLTKDKDQKKDQDKDQGKDKKKDQDKDQEKDKKKDQDKNKEKDQDKNKDQEKNKDQDKDKKKDQEKNKEKDQEKEKDQDKDKKKK